MKGLAEYAEMKRFIVLVALMAATYMGDAQSVPDYLLPTLPPTAEGLGYRGAVKSVSEFQYEITVADSGEIEGILVPGGNHFAASFNKKGFMITQVVYHNDSQFDTYSYTWNNFDQLTRITLMQDDTVRETVSIRRNTAQLPVAITYMDETGAILRKIEQKFGSRNELLHQTEYNQNIIAASASFEYNDQLQITAMRQKNQDGELVVEYRYSYAPSGQPLQMSVYDSFGLLANRTEFIYDSLHRPVEEVVYNPYGKPIQSMNKKYDGTGDKVIEYTVRGAQPDRLIHREISTYNPEGYCTSTKTTSLHQPQREAWNFKYRYDERGNWLEKTHFKQGVPFYRTVRTLTYFD
jgi:hypothetical protein